MSTKCHPWRKANEKEWRYIFQNMFSRRGKYRFKQNLKSSLPIYIEFLMIKSQSVPWAAERKLSICSSLSTFTIVYFLSLRNMLMIQKTDTEMLNVKCCLWIWSIYAKCKVQINKGLQRIYMLIFEKIRAVKLAIRSAKYVIISIN